MRNKSRVILFISMLLIMTLNEIFLKSVLIYILVTLIVMVFVVYDDFIKPTLARKNASDIALEVKEGHILSREVWRVIGLLCIAMLTIRKSKLTVLDFYLLGLIATIILIIITNYYFNNTVLVSKDGIILSNGDLVKWEEITAMEKGNLDLRIKYEFKTKNEKHNFSIILNNEEDRLKLINTCNEHYLGI